MKITIFGASGRIGQHLVEQALSKGYQVTAFVRRANSLPKNDPNLNIIVGNLTDREKLKEAIAGSKACLSALGGGSLTKHSVEIMNGIDLIVSLMEELNVRRFIYISSIGVGESRYDMPQPIRFIVADLLLRVPFADHHKNETRIQASHLDWTIVRPGGLTDGPLSKELEFGSKRLNYKGNPKVSRSSVASFMLSQIADESNSGKAVWLYEK
jgi:uncharacterized protein YbjT (DUF2867 family)